MRNETKSVVVFGLIIDVLVIGGTILARLFYNQAPEYFHQFVAMTLWVTIVAAILCAALVFQIYKTLEQIKKIASERGTKHSQSPLMSSTGNSQTKNNAVLAGILIMAPAIFAIFPMIRGSAAFAHDYLKLGREFVLFIALYFCWKIYVLTKRSLRKS